MKFLNLNKSYSYILTTLLCLVFLGATYFFIYLPRNEKVIEEQRFRTLQNIDNNIHLKLENSTSLIKNLMEVNSTNVDDSLNSKAHLNKYINNYSKNKFILSNFETLKNYKEPANEKKDSLSNSVGWPSFVVDDATKNITLLYKKETTVEVDKIKDTQIVRGSIKYTFQQFIKKLLPTDVFDEYIVFGKNNTLYESFPSGISKPKEDSLLSIKNGIGGSYSRDITVGGKDFKLFLQPINFDTTNKWILGGLLSKKRYQAERSALPPEIIMLLVTMVLAMIIIFPWIKLYQMGSKDRLTLTDGAMSIVVSMLLMSLLFFCFFKYNIGVRDNGSPDSKKILSEKISTAFYNETKKMYSVMKAYDSFRIKNPDILDVTNLMDTPRRISIIYTKNKPSTFLGDSLNKRMLNLLKTPKIDQVFWLDEKGIEKYNWTAEAMNAPHGNFERRAYVNRVVNGKFYYLDGDLSKKYYLDQVVSWVTGTFQSVLSIPSADTTKKYVGAISFTMRSLQDVVLPTGYSFAIINNDGQVLYHSISARNLNENLKSEFLDSAVISSYINARSNGNFATRYYSKNYVVNVSPIKDLPYSIVVFSDTSFRDSRDYEVYSFTFSMLLIVFLIIMAQFCATMLLSSRHSFFKKQLFDTSWIGPKILSHQDYLISSIFNGFIILILIICFKQMVFLQYLFLLFSTFTIAPLCLNILFANRYKKQNKLINRRFKIIATIWLVALLVIINILACNMLETEHFWALFGVEAIMILIGATLINFTNLFMAKLILRICNKYANKCARYLLELEEERKQEKESLIKEASIRLWKYLVENIGKLFISIKSFLFNNNRNYIKTYCLMTLSGLIITSGIPVAFFYFTSYNYEQNLGIRQRQTDYANRLMAQPGFMVDTFKSEPINNKIAIPKIAAIDIDTTIGVSAASSITAYTNFFNYTNAIYKYDTTGIYTDGSWVDAYPSIINYNDINKKFNEGEYAYTRKLLNTFHLTVGEKSEETGKLYIPYSADNSVIYQPLRISTTGDSSISTYRQTNVGDKYLKLNSFNLNYRLPGIFKTKGAFIYWLLLCLALLFFYFIIINILKKLFSLNLPDVKIWGKLDDKIMAENKELNNLLFIIGLPGAGKLKYIIDKINNKEHKLQHKGEDIIYDETDKTQNNVFIADLIKMPDTGANIEEDKAWKDLYNAALEDKNRLVVINHFEYNIQDEYTNLAKLNLLEQLMLKDTSKIMILSTVHPISFLDSLSEVKKLDVAPKPDPNQKPAEPTAKRSYDLERWTVLLGHYRIVMVPIKQETETDEKLKSWQQLIYRETEYTHYLNNMQKSTLDVMDTYSAKKSFIGASPQELMIKNWAKNDMMERADELAYKLQVTSHYFYMYIWQSLTKEEKFLLYDLAEDNLVNSYDNYNLTMLMAKGVIIQPNGQLQFFNKGFKNFILTAIGNTEAMKIKDRIKENGNWSKLRTPFLIVILAILSFLFISQQEAYSKLIAYAVALSAGIPTILKVFSLFDKNATKANT